MSQVPPTSEAALGVLIVDDERQIVDLLTLYLGQQGYRATGAHAPEAAVAAVRADPTIGVVVTDLRMPGLSGPALAEELLRGRAEAQALEIVFITGAGAGDPTLEAFRGHAFQVIRKPFRPSEVAAAVGRARASCAERRRGAAERAAENPEPPLLAAEELARLLGSIVRDMRAPLLPLLAAAEALASGPVPDEATLRAQAGRIREAGLRLASLLDEANAALGPEDEAGGPPPGAG